MKQPIYTFLILFVSTLLSCAIIRAHEPDMKTTTKEKAIEIANIESKSLGYDLGILSVKATKYNTPWNEYLPKDSNDTYYVEKIDKLKNREYWAVYYYPDREKVGVGYKGGDFCIFIDTSTREIVTYILWK